MLCPLPQMGREVSITVTITVTNVDEAPSITEGGAEVDHSPRILSRGYGGVHLQMRPTMRTYTASDVRTATRT